MSKTGKNQSDVVQSAINDSTEIKNANELPDTISSGYFTFTNADKSYVFSEKQYDDADAEYEYSVSIYDKNQNLLAIIKSRAFTIANSLALGETGLKIDNEDALLTNETVDDWNGEKNAEICIIQFESIDKDVQILAMMKEDFVNTFKNNFRFK